MIGVVVVATRRRPVRERHDQRPEPGQRGSFLELSWSGAEPFTLDDGSVRTFLEDGDEVTITATAPAPSGSRIALGGVSGRILPAKERP